MRRLRPDQSQQGFPNRSSWNGRRIVASGASKSSGPARAEIAGPASDHPSPANRVANAASLNLDPHPTGGWLGNFTFNNLKRTARTANLRRTHLWHKQVLVAAADSARA